MLKYQKRFLKYCIGFACGAAIIVITLLIMKKNSLGGANWFLLPFWEVIIGLAIIGILARDGQSLLGGLLSWFIEMVLHCAGYVIATMFGALWGIPLALLCLVLLWLVFCVGAMIVALIVPFDFIITIILFIIQCVRKREFPEGLTKVFDILPIIVTVLFWVVVYTYKL